jgi:Flp pilus assembly protein TadD
LQVSPNNISILNNLGNALFMLGRRDEAVAILRQAAQSDPKNPGVHFNLAMMLLQQGDSAGARAQLTEALRLKPDFAQARQQLDALAPVAEPDKPR